MSSTEITLTVGGPVKESGTYLSRPADDHLFNTCKAGEFAYVLACRQIGKSSLMYKTARELSKQGIKTAVISLDSIGHQTVNADSWYFGLIDELANELELGIDVHTWWEQKPGSLAPTQRFLQFLREVVLVKITEPAVVFVDEIDLTLGLGFTDDFFAAIRSVYSSRARHQAYRRLTFVLLGVATPDELIKNPIHTPFNIGRAIELEDFTRDECVELRFGIETRYPKRGSDYFDQVYDWTNGHPYLTQRLCAAILESPEEDNPDLVDVLVRKYFLAPEGRDDINLQTVQKSVTGDSYALEMLRIYKRVLEDEEPVYDDEQSPVINKLKLYGLVLAQSGKLRVRNKIYAQVFDTLWVDEMLRSKALTLATGLPSKYKILQEIGQGGFATVYLAQLQDTDKTQSVALKLLKTHNVNDSTQVKRFQQEARAVAKLQHPNIIRVLDTGGDENTFFIVMEYISGGTLRDKLKTGPLSRKEAIYLIRRIGAALTCAHQQGIIHRDVNPNNILLDTSQDSMWPRPVLTDFGLIKVLTRDDYTQSQIHSTQIQGTLDYMAPEQWRQEIPTPATDVYALAITFFEILSGQRPFAAKSFLELMDKHANAPFPPLSSVAPGIGSFFDDVLLRAAAKNPSERFDSVDDFIKALEAANAQAEEAERSEQQSKAATAVEAARGYIQKGRYNPEIALAMIEGALEMYPGYLDALRLRGKIRLEQDQVEKALDDYKLAYEQVRDSSSEVGIEYLEALSQVAETFWRRHMPQEAVKYYETIRQILNGEDYEAKSVREIWQKARTRLVEIHYHKGDTAYALGDPENIDDAIYTLDQEIQVLEALKADSESQDLCDKVRLLRVKKYQNVMKNAQAAIYRISAKDSQVRFSSEDIFQHYLAIDEAYQALIELEPEDEQWQESRRKKLKERAKSRYMFAKHALERPEPDYEVGLRHYKALLDIERTKYPGIAQELSLNLDEKIAELQAKVDYDGKYNEIRKLIDSKDYPRALEHLDREFIQAGNYEHRDVARWLWGLVYAKQHEGNLPPEWESLFGFDTLSKRLMRVEQVRIQQLKDRLEPWSQSRILETIRNQTKKLGSYEEQVMSMEDLLNEAVAHGLADTSEIGTCRDELTGIRAQIQKQHGAFFEIDVKETTQKVEAWLKEIEEIETLLQTGNPVKDIPEFLNRSDEAQQAIEKAPMFETLRALESASAEIEQTMEQMKLGVRGQLCSALIDDVGRRDEELARMRQESATAQEALAKAEEEVARTRIEVVKTQKEKAALQQRESFLEQQFEKPNREHEINRYAIPLSLALAVITGGIIVPQIQALPGLSTIKWIALVLLIAYFAYYVWAYYVSQPRGE